MELPLERFSELGNTLYLAKKEEQYQNRKSLAYLGYIIVQVNAGKKAPGPQEFYRKQKLETEPELDYLWMHPDHKKHALKEGSAAKAEAHLRNASDGVADLEGHTEEEQRNKVAEEWGSMNIADLQAYKAQKHRGF